MIDLRNPQADKWMARCFELCELTTPIIAALARKAALPCPVEQSGTLVCPYCYLDSPHVAESHDVLANAIDRMLADGIVLRNAEKDYLRMISKQCKEHGIAARDSRVP